MELEEVKRLSLEPGDIIVLKTTRMLPPEAHRIIEDYMRQVAPGHKCMVLADGMDIEVVRATQA